MMVIVLRDGTIHTLSDERKEYILEAVEAGSFMIDLYGDDDTAIVSSSAIAQILSDEQYDEVYREAKGEAQCAFGYWHSKGEKCGHSEVTVLAEAPADLAYLRSGEERSELSSDGKLWLELIKVNNDFLVKMKVYGPLRKLADLLGFQQTGVLPEEISRATHEASSTPFRWARRAVSEKQFGKMYAGRPGYRILAYEGSDIVLAYKRPIVGSFELLPGEDWCYDTEITRLEAKAT